MRSIDRQAFGSGLLFICLNDEGEPHLWDLQYCGLMSDKQRANRTGDRYAYCVTIVTKLQDLNSFADMHRINKV